MSSGEKDMFSIAGEISAELANRNTANSRVFGLGYDMAKMLLGHHITAHITTETNDFMGSLNERLWNNDQWHILTGAMCVGQYAGRTTSPSARRYKTVDEKTAKALGISMAVPMGLRESALYEPLIDPKRIGRAKTMSGIVKGVDPEHLAIVVNREPKPRIFGGKDRGWVHLIKPDGTPLVEIKVDDE